MLFWFVKIDFVEFMSKNDEKGNENVLKINVILDYLKYFMVILICKLFFLESVYINFFGIK